MKKLLVLMLISASLFSCKKENGSSTHEEAVSGTLNFTSFSPAVLYDTHADIFVGFTLMTDNGERLIISDIKTNVNELYEKYKDLVGKHCWLIYADTGKRRKCWSDVPCATLYRIVEIRKLTEF